MDEDILSQGDDREPRPRRRGIIVALVLVVIAGVVYLVIPRHQHAASAIPAATARASASPSPVFSVFLNLGPPGGPVEPNGIIIRTLPWTDSLRLPVAGTRPTWFWPATGQSEPIGGLPADSAGYQFTRADGGWAVQSGSGSGSGSGSAAKAACGGCAGSARPVWFLADGARAAIRVGAANLVAPAADAGALWLTSYPPRGGTDTAVGTAREVGPTGALLRPPVTLPSGYLIEQGTVRGLLLGSTNTLSGTQSARLWNAASPQANRTFNEVLAANATEIASAPLCFPTCSVQVLNLTTGRATVIRLPAGDSPTGGSFSPGGGLLALQLSSSDDSELAMQLAVVSVTSGQVTPVPGTWVSSDELAGFGWPSDSNNLVAKFTFDSTMRVTSWHPGASELSLAVIKPGAAQASLIVG